MTMSKITRGDPANFKNVRKTVYHHYIRVDEPKSLIFLSGQLARDAEGNLVGAGDMAEQTRQCIRNMRTVLEAAGGTLKTPEGQPFVYGKASQGFKNGWFVARGG